MINTGNYYNDIISNTVAILEREKETIGIKAVFPCVPPFIDLSLFPVVCVTRQVKQPDTFIVVPSIVRIKMVMEIWLQLAEINLVDVKSIDHVIASEIEEKVGVLALKIERVLRKNRTLDGYCLEASLLEIDFRPRMQPAKPQTLVAGAVIQLLAETKNIEVE
ncbi:hypothetical protein AUJ63_04585 [Candidatus Pacearchaeota archaeon CG1_02_35_32]|nr:MAG: hypothetical protein AUJ63_04585 [Candidatus Pacearchaeota archaeon CG1_02_35_32]